MRNHEKFANSAFKPRSRDSEEYERLEDTLEAAERRKKKLEENIRNLREMEKDLEKELNYTNDEIDRLRSIKHSMGARRFNSEGQDTRRLFVRNLEYDTTEQDLEDYFEKYGTISSIKIGRYPITKFSRGFGFVEFTSSLMADTALDNQPHYIGGRKVDACLARSQMDTYKKSKDNKYKPY